MKTQQGELVAHMSRAAQTMPEWRAEITKNETWAEHQRLQSAIVEKARIMLEINEAVGHVCLDVEDTLEATRRLVQFEAEHGIGGER